MISIYEAARIARSYGLSIRDRDVRANFDEANKNDGLHGKSARQYFDGYMNDIAFEICADAYHYDRTIEADHR